MWRNSLHRVLVPVLFVLVGGGVALTSTDCYIKHKQAEAEARARAEAEAAAAAKKAAEEKAAAERAAAERAAAEKAAAERERALKFKVSEYDVIFKETAKKYDLDWRLLAALAKVESNFRHDAVSRSGAVGLMQIMPKIGKSLGYKRAQLFDARTSVDLAAQVLNKNMEMLNLPKNVNEEVQWQLTLACYNAGYGRISDARALARHFEANPNSWEDVSHYLSQLSDPEFAKLKVVKLGKFSGSKETLNHVNRVLEIYKQYCNYIVVP